MSWLHHSHTCPHCRRLHDCRCDLAQRMYVQCPDCEAAAKIRDEASEIEAHALGVRV